MWNKFETDLMIDIQPRGEEQSHVPGPDCDCGPTISQSETGKKMIIHRTYEGKNGFEAVIYEQRKAA